MSANMDPTKLRLMSICLVILIHFLGSSVAQDAAECLPRCWNPVQLNYGVLGSTKLEGAENEEECKALCLNNGTCLGVDWDRTSNGCWFQLTALDKVYAVTNINYWSLANCTDECVSYCWQTVKIDFHVHPGTLVVAQDENHCKLLCSNTSTCRGVDWKSDNSSCWLINSSEKFREKLTGLRHWDIIRNLSTPCQNSTEYFTYTSTLRTEKVPLSSVSITSNTVTSVYEYINYLKESTTGWKTAAIVLAGSLGLCILIIVGLVINTVRLGRILETKGDAENTEKSDNYHDLKRTDIAGRSEDAIYTDLVEGNAAYHLPKNN